MNLLRHRRERLALRAEREAYRAANADLRAERNDLRDRLSREMMKSLHLAEQCGRVEAERDQAEAELRALRGEVA
jgi:regulator of replication initiation timing